MCGAEEKTWGPKTEDKLAQGPLIYDPEERVFVPFPQAVPTPDDQLLTRDDSMYLQFFFERNGGGCIFSFDLWCIDLLIPVHRIVFPVASKPLRYAVLAIASFLKAGHQSVETFQYLGQCYKHIQEAIKKSAFIDIVYTSYAIIVLTFRLQSEAVDTILSHLLGVCEGLKWLQNTPADLTIEEMLMMQQIWENTFRSLYFKLWLPRHQSWPSFAMQLDKSCSILHSCRFILEPSVRLKRSGVMNLELSTLTLYMQYYFSQFLLRTNLIVGDPNQYGTQSITESLRQVLRQIREVVTRLSIERVADQIQKLSEPDPYLPVELECLPLDNLQSQVLLSLYFSTMLIDNMLLPAVSDRSDELATLSALALCRLSNPEMGMDIDEYLPLKLRNLVFAGLILTTSSHPDGKYLPFPLLSCRKRLD